MSNNSIMRFNKKKQKGFPLYMEMPDTINNMVDIQALKAKYLKKKQ